VDWASSSVTRSILTIKEFWRDIILVEKPNLNIVLASSVATVKNGLNFKPPPVSRWYRFDWQYAVDVSHIPVLQFASVVLAVTPIILSQWGLLGFLGRSAQLTLAFLWPAAFCFVLAWSLVWLACPKFIREYRDFGQFKTREHAHRWIVWEFYNNLESLAGWKSVIRETLSKGLSCKVSEIPDDEAKSELSKFPERSVDDSLQVFPPRNIKRDIYLPIYCDGEELVLFMVEEDPKLPIKEKELFWILYSQAAKERPVRRCIFWILVTIAALLLAANVIKNIVYVFIHLHEHL
jgi:hypothetical protein